MKRHAFLLWLLCAFLSANFSNLCAQSTCSYEAHKINPSLPTPSLTQPIQGNDKLKGTLTAGKALSGEIPHEAKVEICIERDGKGVSYSATPNNLGEFGIPLSKKLSGTELIYVQTVLESEDPSHGPSIEPVIKVLRSCKNSQSNPLPQGQKVPTFKITEKDGAITLSGKAELSDGKFIRVCRNDEPILDSSNTSDIKDLKVIIDKTGIFKFSTPISIDDKDKIAVQIVDNDNPQTMSAEVPVGNISEYRDARYILIGGFENFWFASQGAKSDPFVQLFLEGPEFGTGVKWLNYWAPWGNVRLLGTPQPSTNGVGSSFTDPTGTITKQDFSTVGTSIDWQLGVDKFLVAPGRNWGRVAIIGSLGGTNPLSSQDSPITFKAPGQGTSECAEFLSRFTVSRGYPALTAGDSQTMSCLKSNGIAVTDIAFTNQDRSNALLKWAAGFRAEGSLKCTDTYEKCSDSFGLLDLTIGQDAAMTRGQLRNFVMKADGTFPIKTGESSYLYLYGSAYLRLKHNIDLQPLILAADPQAPSVPNAAVVVLPLRQPDRDFFRIGVGINLGQVFCKLSVGPCNEGK